MEALADSHHEQPSVGRWDRAGLLMGASEGAPSALVVSAGTVRFVALRREDLTPEQLEHQRALDRSWAVAQNGLADPEFRAYLGDSMRRLDSGDPAPALTREEFLALTKGLDG